MVHLKNGVIIIIYYYNVTSLYSRGCVKTQFYGLKAQKAHSPRQRLGCTD
jgi:hypothetical protein